MTINREYFLKRFSSRILLYCENYPCQLSIFLPIGIEDL